MNKRDINEMNITDLDKQKTFKEIFRTAVPEAVLLVRCTRGSAVGQLYLRQCCGSAVPEAVL
jgi:hypothetical protein